MHFYKLSNVKLNQIRDRIGVFSNKLLTLEEKFWNENRTMDLFNRPVCVLNPLNSLKEEHERKN